MSITECDSIRDDSVVAEGLSPNPQAEDRKLPGDGVDFRNRNA